MMDVSAKSATNISVQDDGQNWNHFIQKILAFIQVYWYPVESQNRAFSEIIRSWGMLFLLLILLVGLVGFNAFNSFVFRDLIDFTEAKDLPKLTRLLVIYSITLISMVGVSGFSKFIKKRIALDWYQWINQKILQQYFQNRAYYQINFKENIANPDQRLAQEIEPIARMTLDFLTTCFEKLIEMFVFITILWSISRTIAIVLFIYTVIGNILATYIAQQLNQINKKQLEVEATYSYSLTHVRNHAESIAFFRGEEKEINIIQRRFNQVIDVTIGKIGWERTQEFFNKGYEAFIQIFPFLIVSPLYIIGRIELGEVNQASYACYFFSTALAVLVDEFSKSGEFINYIERLEDFSQALTSVSQTSPQVNNIQVIENDHLAFEDVTLQTPDVTKVIVEHLSLAIEPGTGLLIVGPSGRGKSSLLRAISGLWNAGTGDLIRPPLDDILFLPQRPYIILGTLREQLIYPQTTNPISELELKEVLQQVNLGNIIDRVKSFDEEMPWESILSLGEQQRLAFARLLINRPDFVILDEATSALDLKNEDQLYKQLQETGKTFISVGHRDSLFNYHQKVLELSEDSSWRLVDIQDYRSPTMSVTNLSQSQAISEPIEIATEIISQSQAISEPIEMATEIISQSQVISEPIEMATEIELKDQFSHQQMQKLTTYSLSTIRNKASRGQTIIAKDGLSYYYDKSPNILKWVRV